MVFSMGIEFVKMGGISQNISLDVLWEYVILWIVRQMIFQSLYQKKRRNSNGGN